MPTTQNPYGAFNFLVTINNVPAAEFTECQLPVVSIDVIEYREGADLQSNVHKLPGLVKYGNLTLKRGIASSGGSPLWSWFSGFINGNGIPSGITVKLLDREKNPVLEWSFTNAWPVKYESPPLNGRSNSLAIETLEVAVEGMKFSGLGQGS